MAANSLSASGVMGEGHGWAIVDLLPAQHAARRKQLQETAVFPAFDSCGPLHITFIGMIPASTGHASGSTADPCPGVRATGCSARYSANRPISGLGVRFSPSLSLWPTVIERATLAPAGTAAGTGRRDPPHYIYQTVCLIRGRSPSTVCPGAGRRWGGTGLRRHRSSTACRGAQGLPVEGPSASCQHSGGIVGPEQPSTNTPITTPIRTAVDTTSTSCPVCGFVRFSQAV